MINAHYVPGAQRTPESLVSVENKTYFDPSSATEVHAKVYSRLGINLSDVQLAREVEPEFIDLHSRLVQSNLPAGTRLRPILTHDFVNQAPTGEGVPADSAVFMPADLENAYNATKRSDLPDMYISHYWYNLPVAQLNKRSIDQVASPTNSSLNLRARALVQHMPGIVDEKDGLVLRGKSYQEQRGQLTTKVANYKKLGKTATGLYIVAKQDHIIANMAAEYAEGTDLASTFVYLDDQTATRHSQLDISQGSGDVGGSRRYERQLRADDWRQYGGGYVGSRVMVG
jgi:hypothetical protein